MNRKYPHLEHGTATTYRKGCPCDECREAYRAKQREYRLRRKRRERDKMTGDLIVSINREEFSKMVRNNRKGIKPLIIAVTMFGTDETKAKLVSFMRGQGLAWGLNDLRESMENPSLIDNVWGE